MVIKQKARLVKADGSICSIESSILREFTLDIYVNGKFFQRLACTWTDITELVTGRLITEGFINGSSDIESIDICESTGRVDICLKHEIKKELSALQSAQYKSEWIFGLADKFKENSALHKKTNGTHSCYLSYNGGFLRGFEDISRHNALDKVVGYADINGCQRSGCILFTTGRVPADMVKKSVMAEIPVLVSKAVPTAEAVEMAKKYNLSLICRAWPDSYEVYN